MIRYHQVRAADRRLRRLLRLLRKHERNDRRRMQETYDRVLRDGVRRRIEVTSTAGLAYEKWKDPLACLMIEGDGVAYPYDVIDETTVEVAWMDSAGEPVYVERLVEQNRRLLMLAQQAMNAHLLYINARDEDRNHLATQMDMAIMPFLGMVAADLDATA